MKTRLLFAAASLFLAAPALAGDGNVKVGMLTTLSGPAAALGTDIRDGFALALKLQNGKLGGVPVEMVAVDDGQNVESARQSADRLLKRDNVDLMTGIVFSNIALAVVPSVLRDGKIYLSPNAGPAELAGKDCHQNYFNVAWQNDNLHEAAGQHMQARGFKNVYILAPNYPAGRDALTGFKRFFKGQLAGEVYTKLGQVDYAPELANLRAAKPDAVFFFLPGGMGVNFVKQYAQAGMIKETPLFGPGFSFSEDILRAVGDVALGVTSTAQWNHQIDNPANKTFVAAFRKEYGRAPTLYASQAYDTANLLGSALKATGGKVSDTNAMRAALRKADFASVRGSFAFGPNHHPIQDIYVQEVAKSGDEVINRLGAKVFTRHADAYAAQCKM